MRTAKIKGGLLLLKEAIGFGATIEAAKEDAAKKLGASDFEDVQFEVVSMPKKKFLGLFGGADAEVKAFIEVPDKKAKPQKKTNNKKDNQKAPKAVKVADSKPEKKIEVKEAPAEKGVKEEKESGGYSEPVDASEISVDTPAGKAVAYIKNVLKTLNCGEVDIKVANKENGSLITLEGDDLNIVIGRRGETLDALQYLTSLAANNGGGHYKISLNIGNYREKREETLKTLAQKVAAQALKVGKCRTLEPMNPYERRIIHTAVQEIEGVVSGSFGEGSERRVVIAPEGVELRPRRQDNRRNQGRRPRNSKSASSAVTAIPSREPKKDSDIPLYGKIN